MDSAQTVTVVWASAWDSEEHEPSSGAKVVFFGERLITMPLLHTMSEYCGSKYGVGWLLGLDCSGRAIVSCQTQLLPHLSFWKDAVIETEVELSLVA